MKAWQIAIPVGLAAAAAAAVAVISGSKKGDDKSTAKKAKSPAAKKAEFKNPKTGVYSFVSGFNDAATVNVNVTYDGDKHSFDVIGEEFLAYSSDSHVAVLYCSEVDMQLEYAGFYSGEGFAEMSETAKNKFKGFGTVSYNGLDGIRYLDGDAMCICLPIPDDKYSYILVTVLKHNDCKTPLEEIYSHPEVDAVLSSVEYK